ncbi:MAG: hypothetical protein CK424_05150 [Legionella sp.]|nr:MAG: hypothetical protein CK424_05150 [Legionella sp.]
MSAFFSALNPLSRRSGVTVRAVKYPYKRMDLWQEIPDRTVDLVISFLWRSNLSVLNGIYETFTVFYGDHFDKQAKGIGQKGILDFTILPLLSRKLIADTYLERRKQAYFSNILAWVVALPIQTITFSLALACTLALFPVVVLVTVLRYLYACFDRSSAQAIPVTLSYSAFHTALYCLDRAEIRTQDNIRRLLEHPQNLAALAAVMQRMTHVIADGNSKVLNNQAGFDFLLEHRNFWSDSRITKNLDGLYAVNQPLVQLNELKELVAIAIGDIDSELQAAPIHHALNNSTKSAFRLKKLTKLQDNIERTIDASMIRHITNDQKSTDEETLQCIRSAISKFNDSLYTEQSSRVSSKALLQYCWNAVYDHKQWRLGVTQELGLTCFYGILYEVGMPEVPVEAAFSKMIEGMASIHRLCESDAILKLSPEMRQMAEDVITLNDVHLSF